MRRLRAFASFALTMMLAGAANGQQPAAQPSRIDPIRRSLARQIAEDRGHFDVQSVDYFALLWHPSDSGSLLQVLQQYEEERADKQVGATSSAPGSTTLVSKGTVPKILGLAVENGAIARSQSGTTVTFRGNLGGAVRAVSNKGFFGWTPMGLTPDTDPAMRVLGRASGSVSFDTSRGADNASNTFVGDQQQLSQWTLRAQIVNQRDPQGRAALDGWKRRVLQSQGRLSIATLELTTTLDMDPALKNWVMRVDADVQKAMPISGGSRSVDEIASDIEKALKEGEATFPESALQNATALALSAYATSATDFIKNRHDLLDSIAAGARVGLAYTKHRPLPAPPPTNN